MEAVNRQTGVEGVKTPEQLRHDSVELFSEMQSTDLRAQYGLGSLGGSEKTIAHGEAKAGERFLREVFGMKDEDIEPIKAKVKKQVAVEKKQQEARMEEARKLV